MENKFNNIQKKILTDDIPPKANIVLPVLALAFDFAPVLFYLLALLLETTLSLFLFSVLLPFAGVIIGIISLCQGKKRIGKSGIIISIISIALPIVFVLTIILLFQTGAIVLGM